MDRYDLPEDRETEAYAELVKRREEMESFIKGNPHEVIFGIRPESIKVVDGKEENALKVTVKLSELLGDQYYVHFDFNDRNFLTKIETEDEINEGDTIYLKMLYNKMHMFDPKSGKTIYMK